MNNKNLIPKHIVCKEKILYITIALLFLVFRMHLPVSIFSYAGADDGLFFKNALSITLGRWLGEFNELTLVKGPGFPIFLALNNFLGMPITLSLALLYLGSCWLFVYSLRIIGMPFFLGIFLFSFILFQPALVPIRILRETIQLSFFLLALAAFILAIAKHAPYWNAILSGFAFSAFSMTREEGIWIFPGMLILLAGAFFQFRSGFYSDWNPVKKILVPFLLVACLFVPIQIVSTINYLKYDYYGVVDIKARGFRAALGAVQSVVFGDPIPFLPAPAASRAEIYKYSPAFSELRDVLEINNPFKNIPRLSKLYPHTANDIPGGWFLWAFRDAVSKRGYYKNGATAESFYSRVAAEIHVSQNEGLLPKRTSPIPLMPPISLENLSQIPKSFSNAFKSLLYQTPIPLTGGPSVGSTVQLERFASFLGNPKAMPPETVGATVRIHGWYIPKNGGWLELRGNSGDFSYSKPRRLPSLDLVRVFKNSNLEYNRFSFEAKRDGDQYLQADNYGCSVAIKKLISQKSGIVDFDAGTLFLDGVNDASSLSSDFKGLQFKKTLIIFYKNSTPFLFWVGFFCLGAAPLVCIVQKKKPINSSVFLFSVGLSLLVSCVSLICVVAVVDVTSFPAVNANYLTPAFPLIPAFAFTALSTLISLFKKSHVHFLEPT